MKKNFKKIMAVIAMMTTAASMSLPTFAAVANNENNIIYGDINGDGNVTTLDASIVYNLSGNATDYAKSFFKNDTPSNETGPYQRLRVTQSLYDNEGDPTVNNTSALQEGAVAILNYVLGKPFDEVVPKTEYVKITVGGIPVKVATDPEASEPMAMIATVMETAVSGEGNTARVTKQVTDMNSNLAAYSVSVTKDDGTTEKVSLTEEAGWAKLGDIILLDNASEESVAAFNAIMPPASASEDEEAFNEYLTNFASNAAAAFPNDDQDAVSDLIENMPAALEEAGIKLDSFSVSMPASTAESTGADSSTLTKGDALSWITENILYGTTSLSDLTADGSIVITMTNGQKFSIGTLTQ